MKKALLKILSLAATLCFAFAIAACGGNGGKELKLIKDLPTTVFLNSEIYFREYINVEYGAEYELFATYNDNESGEKETDKQLESLMFRFENVSDYSFKLKKVGGETLDFSIKCVAVTPEFAETEVYRVKQGYKVNYLEDLVFWCRLNLVDESASLDPEFKYEFSKVVIKSALVNGSDREESLEGKTDYTFDENAEYVFYLTASNGTGSKEAQIIVSTMDIDKHSNEVTGYVFKDSSKIEFETDTLKDFGTPESGATIKTRLGADKFDATYNAANKRYTIENFDKTLVEGESYRLYLTDKDGDDFSVSVAVPDLIITESNFKELETVTDGIIILGSDVNMDNVDNYGAGREGKEYTKYYFKGTFDGRGYTVSNYKTYYTVDGKKKVPSHNGAMLWGVDGATIKNVIFTNGIVDGLNALVAGRCHNYTAFRNVAVEVSSMKMNGGKTDGAGAISDAGELGTSYTDCLIYVRKNSGAGILSSGFVNGTYCRSAVFDNVYLVSATDLPVAPNNRTDVVPSLVGDYQRMTAIQAKNKYTDNEDFGTDLLNKAAATFFSGAVEDDPDTIVHLTQSNISEIENAGQGTYILDEDIDMTGLTWTHTSCFSGTFNGQGHTISNLSLDNTGLFGAIDGATIKNIAFKNVKITNGCAFFTTQNSSAKNTQSKDVTIQNVVVDIQSHTNSAVGNWRLALFGYQTGGTIKMSNVVINVNSNIKGDYFGFISTHAGTNQIYDKVLCVGALDLHSTDGNAKKDGSVNEAYVPHRYKTDGTTEAEAGVDYSVQNNLTESLLSQFYASMSDDVKTMANGVFATELQNITHLTKSNIAEQLLIPTDGYYVLDEDIDMSEFTSWGSTRTAEGRAYTNYYFKGTFNGNGHTISNFNVTQTSYNGGLFWSLDGATIKNVVFKNAKITTNNVGLIASRAKNGAKIENVFVELDSVYTTGNGVLSAIEESIIFNNVAIYVKTVTAGGGTSSAAIAGTYARSIYVSGLYYITDTELNFTPKHNATKDGIITAIKTLDGKEEAVKDTDYYTLSVEQAKAVDTNTLKTDLLKNAFATAFSQSAAE